MAKKATKKIVLSTNHNGNYDFNEAEIEEIVQLVKAYVSANGIRMVNVVSMSEVLKDVNFINKEVAMQWLVRADNYLKDVFTNYAEWSYILETLKNTIRLLFPKETKAATIEDFIQVLERPIDACVSSFKNLLVQDYSFRSGKDVAEIRLDLIEDGIEGRIFEQIRKVFKVEVERFF